jgi:dihydrofolate reductase
MARLIYSALASLDGYIEDEQGLFDWAAPDDEVLAAVNALERPIGTYLYGRRMYETMVFWETASAAPDQSAGERDFAELWRVAEKVVYSRTLQTVTSSRTRIEREFDHAAVRQLKETSATNATCFSTRSSSVAASAHCRTRCAPGLSSWMSAGSAAASSTSTTESASDPHGAGA